MGLVVSTRSTLKRFNTQHSLFADPIDILHLICCLRKTLRIDFWELSLAAPRCAARGSSFRFDTKASRTITELSDETSGRNKSTSSIETICSSSSSAKQGMCSYFSIVAGPSKRSSVGEELTKGKVQRRTTPQKPERIHIHLLLEIVSFHYGSWRATERANRYRLRKTRCGVAPWVGVVLANLLSTTPVLGIEQK